MTTKDELFGRVTKVTIDTGKGHLKFDGEELEIRFEVPFDDDSVPNVSTVQIFNLTTTTINRLKKGQNVVLVAGYRNDNGVLVEAKITKVISRYEGPDKITTITMKEGTDFSGVQVTPQTADAAKKYVVKKRVKLAKPVKTTTVGKNGRKYTKTVTTKTVNVTKTRKQTMNITFANGTTGMTIIKRLTAILGAKPAEINLPKNKVYKTGFKVTGKIESKLVTVVKDCGAAMYWRKGKMVIRSIEVGNDERFVLKEETGLLEPPAEYEDEDVKGYQVRCLLQHRISTASIITLESKTAKGKFRARKGKHSCDGSNFETNFEVI